jgi:hypothetical protein
MGDPESRCNGNETRGHQSIPFRRPAGKQTNARQAPIVVVRVTRRAEARSLHVHGCVHEQRDANGCN